jgi:VWFA-related protein
MRRIIPHLIPRILLVSSLLAQAPPPEDHTIRISVNLVEVDAVVVDRKGNPIKDLTASDFEVLQDKKAQQIRSVQWIPWGAETQPARPEVSQSKNTAPAPVVPGRSLNRADVRRTIAIVIDDLGLSFESIARLKPELKKYIRDRVQPTDLVAILNTGRSMGALSQFTNDKRLLLNAVDQLRWSPWGRQGISGLTPLGLTMEERARRQVPSAGRVALNPETDPDVMRNQMFMAGTLGAVRNLVLGLRAYPGRKSLLLISESMPLNFRSQRGDASTDQTQTFGSNTIQALQQLGDAANRSFVVIDTVDPRGLMTAGLQASDDTSEMSTREVTQRVADRNSDVFESQNGLSYLASETGGTFQFNNNDIGDMVRKAVDGVGGYYLITYRPNDETFLPKEADKWHRVQVRVKREDLRVRSRRGFFGKPDRELAAAPGPQTLGQAMLSPFAKNDVRVRMTGYHVEDPKAGPIITALLHIDGKDLTFEPSESGGYKSMVDVLSVTFTSDGKVESQSGRGFNLVVANDTELARVRQNGIVYTVYHPAKKPGGFQMRIGVKERSSAKMGTASQFIEIPNLKKTGLTLSSLLVQSTKAETRILGGPAVRSFVPKDELLWGARILNAKRGKDNQPQLTRRVLVYHEGKIVFQSPDQPWKQSEIDDLVRLPITGMLSFGAAMKPGDYVMQLVVTDQLESNEKKRTATQVIDFEVVESRT